jgi:PAS domain S-box-containing protein
MAASEPKPEAALRLQAALVENASDAIIATDEHLNITVWNPAAERIYGWRAEEVIGRPVTAVIPAEFSEATREAVHRQLREEGVWSGEIAQRRRDGSNLRVLASTAYLCDSAGVMVGAVTVNHDITARRQAEQALRESEAHYRSLFENMQEGFALCRMIYDERGQPQDFVYLEVNAAFEALIGLKDVIGKPISVVIPELKQTNPEILSIYSRVASTGKPERFEGYISSLGIWLAVSAYCPEPGHFAAVFDNINERKRAEENLARRLIMEMAVARAAEVFASGSDDLTPVLGALGGALGAQCAFVLRLSADGSQIENPHLWRAPDYALPFDHFPSYPTDAFPWGYARSMRDIIIPDIAALPEEASLEKAKLLAFGARALLLTPIFDAAGRLLGHIGFSVVGQPHQWVDEDIHAVHVVAERIGAYWQWRKSQEALRESEETYRALVQGLPDVVMRFDRDGHHLFVSENVTRVVDLSPSQFLGKTHRELGFPESTALFWEEAIRTVFDTGKPYETEFSFAGKGGTTIFDWRLSPEFDAQGRVQSVLSISRDVTAQRQAEQSYQTLFREMLDGFAAHEIILDEQGRPANYRFLVINPAFERLTGLKAEDVVGKTVLEVLPGTERSWIEAYGRVALTGEPAVFEDYHSQLDKHYAVTAFRSAPNQFACIFVDITERKQAEEELRRSQERYRALVEHLPGAAYSARLDEFCTILYISPQIETLTGYAPEEWLADPLIWRRLTHPDDQPRSRATYLRTLATGEPFADEYRLLTRDGRAVWVHDEGTVIRDDAGQPLSIQGILTDVSERKRAEQALQKSEAQLSIAMKMANLGHWELDIASGMFTFTDNFYEMFHTTAKEMGGYQMSLADYASRFVHPEDASLVAEETRKAIEADDPYFGRYVEHRMRYADGSPGHIAVRFFITKDDKGKTIKTYGVNQDITERKRAEEALRQSEQAARRAVEQLRMVNQMAAALTAGLDFELLMTRLYEQCQQIGDTDSFYVALYDQASEMISFPFYIIQGERHTFPERDIRQTPGLTGYVIAARQTLYLPDQQQPPAGVQVVQRPNDPTRSYIGIPLLLGNEVVGVLSMQSHTPGAYAPEQVRTLELLAAPTAIAIQNSRLYEQAQQEIEQRKRAEEEQAKLQEQLFQAQKMEAVGRLAGGVAHDFNNQLTAIIGYSQFLLESLETTDPRADDVRQILQAAERSAGLTRQLLAFSRKQTLQPVLLNLNDEIANMEKMVRRLIGEDIRLVFVPGANVGQIKADPTQLGQVIMNLAVNARDAMPDGGSLTFETRNVTLDEEYARRNPEAQPGRYVMLAISDTGVGMSAEVRTHLFEPFFTTKGIGKGTGLGLATVYGIVRQSGGHINVYSEPGQGAFFWIYLPRVDEEIETQKVEAAPTRSLRGSESVLVVEDEEQVRQMVCQALRGRGYRVLEASSAEQAIQLVGETSEPIQLLLTDVVLTGMNGRAGAEKLTVLRPGLKVLYMSGYTDDAVVRHGILEASMSYMAKPFAPSDLAAKVRDVLDG